MCSRCFKFWGPMERDHVWPKSKGGPDAWWNRQTLCRTHNRQKGAKYRDYHVRNLLVGLLVLVVWRLLSLG